MSICATCGSDGSACVDCQPCDYCGGELTGEEEMLDTRHLFPAGTDGVTICEYCILQMMRDNPKG